MASANIVGYQTKDVRKNLSQQVCTFDQIGVEGGVLDIQKLIPVDADGEPVGDGAATIQFITDRGKLNDQYTYYLAKELGPMQTMPGWYNEDEEEAEYAFASGEAFQVSAAEAFNFQYSGEVNMAETDVPFRKNLSFQSNIRPCEVNIQDITPVDADGEAIGDGAITIQIFTDRGKLDVQYTYYLPKELGPMQTVAGWYDEDEEIADLDFAAGQGFKLSAAQAGYLRFPEM